MWAKNARGREQRTLSPSFPASAPFHGTRDSRHSLRSLLTSLSLKWHRHCCITFEIYGFVRLKKHCFCFLRMWKDLNKNRLTSLKLSFLFPFWFPSRFMAILCVLIKLVSSLYNPFEFGPAVIKGTMDIQFYYLHRSVGWWPLAPHQRSFLWSSFHRFY